MHKTFSFAPDTVSSLDWPDCTTKGFETVYVCDDFVRGLGGDPTKPFKLVVSDRPKEGRKLSLCGQYPHYVNGIVDRDGDKLYTLSSQRMCLKMLGIKAGQPFYVRLKQKRS
jgi:hypothetical protein